MLKLLARGDQLSVAIHIVGIVLDKVSLLLQRELHIALSELLSCLHGGRHDTWGSLVRTWTARISRYV